MQIKPTDKTVKQLLEGGFYQIPRFQRPYSWDRENVDDLWADAIANDVPDYFIGSFVLYRDKSSGDEYMVVDGQQRLTTLTLLLAAVRNEMHALGRTKLSKGLQKLIEREDIDNNLRFILKTETSYPYLQEYIQKYGDPELPMPAGAEEDALKLAFEHLSQKVSGAVAAIDDDNSIPGPKKSAAKEKRLLTIRDNAMRLQVIVVELDNEDDAYLIFETLNTRGKDLGVADLVKNHLTRLLKQKTKGVDVAKDKWNSIRGLLDLSAADIDTSTFVYHAWLSRYPYVGEKALFKQVKKRVTKAEAAAFLDDLVSDAALYRQVLEPKSHVWTKEERQIAGSLAALNIFKVVQPVPMTLAIMRIYRADGLTLKQAAAILRDMENFHVQFTAITAQRTGGGTARMYAAAAEALSKAKDKNKRAQVLKEFKAKLRERIPSLGEFTSNFDDVEFHSANTKQRALVQYLLQRFDAAGRAGLPVDYDQMTIEHVAPESPQHGAPTLANVGKIGNLLLLPKDLNVQLGNQAFAAKIVAYKQNQVDLGTTLGSAAVWSDAEISERTKELAKLAFEKVFRV